ncbi:MAG: MFS transporter [Alphaproteobacteria bacterium]|nr:MFS transporter [Alphaproteobacteria bacterium]
MSPESQTESTSWGDLLRGTDGVICWLVILATALHALQILVIAIIMPTVVADIGGAAYYTWPAMLYTIGAIVGAACVGPLWAAAGRRNGFAASAAVFLIGSVGCALAPDMAILNIARMVQGFAGGLLNGGGLALISVVFGAARRKRVLALTQGVWMVAQLMGPVVGGAFAEIGWWRGSFWVMPPLAALFITLVYLKLPAGPGEGGPRPRSTRFPFVRLAMLAAGVFAVGLAGPTESPALRWGLMPVAVLLVGRALWLDHRAENRLYPTGAVSLFSPIGPALWILFLGGMVQTAVLLFLPLLLQVVHGVTPLFISFVSIVISFGWTAGTFAVSGLFGRREDLALVAGPVLMIVGLVGITITAQLPLLVVLTIAALVMGVGIGVHFVLLQARTMGNARPGEERITAAAMPSIRALGTAFGAAAAGLLSTMSGLGDATDPVAVGNAIVLVYGVNLVPLIAAAALMIWLVRLPPAKGQGRE